METANENSRIPLRTFLKELCHYDGTIAGTGIGGYCLCYADVDEMSNGELRPDFWSVADDEDEIFDCIIDRFLGDRRRD